MAIEQLFFRQVMGRFATGVTVVTTRNQETLGGLTVSAFCSVSLQPPLVLICIDLNSITLPLIRESKIFAVNMLTEQQEHFSRCFATPSSERFEHFCHAPYFTAATGAPIIEGAHAFVDTHVVAEYPAGDHLIFLGQVEAMGTEGRIVFASGPDQEQPQRGSLDGDSSGAEEAPLLYYRGQYRHLANGYQQPSLAKPHEQQRS